MFDFKIYEKLIFIHERPNKKKLSNLYNHFSYLRSFFIVYCKEPSETKFYF